MYSPSTYEELLSFYPMFYRDVYEMNEILRTCGKLGDKIVDNINLVIDNNFVLTADEATIIELEKFLWLETDKTRPLDERRRLVYSFFVGFGKISATKIKNIITSLTGAVSKVEFINDSADNAILNITLQDADYNKYANDVLEIFSRKLPAHIFYKIIFFAVILSQTSLYKGVCVRETTKETHFIDTGGIRHIYGTVLRESSEERYFISWEREKYK